MKSRHTVTFQHTKPVFVKQPFKSHGRFYEKSEEFPWEVKGLDVDTVSQLYYNGFLFHNEELEKENKGKVGDGLDELTLKELHAIVDKINETVQEKSRTETEYKKKKVPKSPNSKSKQMGLIRRWRNIYGDME